MTRRVHIRRKNGKSVGNLPEISGRSAIAKTTLIKKESEYDKMDLLIGMLQEVSDKGRKNTKKYPAQSDIAK